MKRVKTNTFSALGLMSGTSADGVSAAWIDAGRTVTIRCWDTSPFPRKTRKRILALKEASAGELCEANMWLGRLFAGAAKRLIKKVGRRPDVIGSHGQTVYHVPRKASLQIGEPSVIAEETGVTTAADFRPRDIAAGGEGAPLTAYFDRFVFGGRHLRAMQNIGGIGNVTAVGRRVGTKAFDTGPGNCLIDEAIRISTGGRRWMDRDGRTAARGRADRKILERLLAHPFLGKRPPKSTGREDFSREFLESRCGEDLRKRPRDVVATLTYFTARTIADAYKRHLPPVEEVVVSGGGAFNRTLMWHLEWLLFPVPVRSLRMYGFDPLAKEPAAFALLALEAVRGRVNNVPGATGARPAVLGKIVPGKNFHRLMERCLPR